MRNAKCLIEALFLSLSYLLPIFSLKKHKLIHLLQAQREETPAVAATATIACLKSAKAKLNVSLCGQKKGISNVMKDWVALETEMVIFKMTAL